MSTCMSELLDGSATRMKFLQISNSVDIGLLDAYIGLIPNDKASL